MNLIKRIKRIWDLGEYEIKGTDKGFEIIGSNIKEPEPPKMAVIIKRKSESDIIKEVLNQE